MTKSILWFVFIVGIGALNGVNFVTFSADGNIFLAVLSCVAMFAAFLLASMEIGRWHAVRATRNFGKKEA